MKKTIIFCKIIQHQIPAKIAYEDDTILAFHDIEPQTPVHILVIPKKHIDSMDAVDSGNSSYITHIFEKIPEIAKNAGITNGYRVVSNCGKDACQSVKHLHFHILGGIQMSERILWFYYLKY